MNNRIIELANKANEDIGYTFKMEEAKQLHQLMENFAELIVKEFSKQVQLEGRFGLEREQTLIRLCCENAKKHFGVEE
jgi:hypothetical protein